ncbi:MAG TPA: T9SS type A sorting domain-containing protein [Flavobacteriales bacterium]|nr:T9SS type A sorting domain-containing protein [Flavobacteriales bacterium]
MALFLLSGATAQRIGPERVEPLHARPAKEVRPMLRSGNLHEWFIYAYQPQTIPVVDDFSVDRTRHLDADSDDPGVTLTETVYHLEVLGVSTPDMVFMFQAATRLTVDIQPDTVILTTDTLEPVNVRVFDISTYPATWEDHEMWPPYVLRDTVGDPTTDTTYLAPDLVQDSLLVYTVPPADGTYLNPDNTNVPLILWESDHAYVNGTYPIDPPTIGVASFDGMDRDGWPYEAENPNVEGIADVMTSVPLNWPPGTEPADSVYLSFFYQPQGRSGDSDVDPTDSLRVEFYSPGQDSWFLEWATPYTALHPFEQAMVPITYAGYLEDGFRVRFSNRATLGGAVDHWHVDYVRIGLNRSVTDTLLQDVAYVYPANTLLSPWTSVPLAKYNADPAHYMAASVEQTQCNRYNVDALITYGHEMTTDCGNSASRDDGGNVFGNALTTFTSSHAINSGAQPYTYDLGACPGAAFATVKFWTMANPDALRHNDTTSFTQEISNYYSYDDGSAELGYSLNTNGGRIAYRFDTQGQDSLRAVRMYFDPIFTYGDIPNDPRDGSFLLTVWQDLNSAPIYQNISFSNPEYRPWGPDHFVEYALDSTIAVGGTFYVGWTQTNAVRMNLGMDMNRVNNDRMFFNVGNVWQQSAIAGSWMIRPVMVSAVDPFASVPEADEVVMTLFPNPATDEVRLRVPGETPASIELYDATGRRVASERYRTDGVLSIGNVVDGLYVVRALDDNGRSIAQARLVVQRP